MAVIASIIKSNKEVLFSILFLSVLSWVAITISQQYAGIFVLENQIQKLSRKANEIKKRNQTLKEALGELNSSAKDGKWVFFQQTLPYQERKILNLELAPLPSN